ncbi:hypothetical protein PR048_003938 [Dryococelus australis]|uniref:Uncharacterized protein n=1 Tax=Dryococelus australis TaxID=614101 RepID=A0ABQ9I445_9NEOP|nr:hypothetical protein PR048_003938 [Dryococelus australis]
MNKKALIYLIANCLQQKGCNIIHADADADVDRVDKSIIESTGCKPMLSLFKGRQSVFLASVRCSTLCRKVSITKTFVEPERLPPTTSATKLHSLRKYLQVMQWMVKKDGMDPSDWGWKLQEEKMCSTHDGQES